LKDTYRIREAERSDSKQISLLFFEWLQFKERDRTSSITKSISRREILVATEGKKGKEILIGFVHGIVHNDPISGGSRLFVTSLYVKPSHRNRGVGTKLLKSLISEAKIEKGIVGVEISTIHRKAVRFYKAKFGFVQVKGDIGEVFLEKDIMN
jgi:ribosomal protein S18 acetylase RimI-like enzyme